MEIIPGRALGIMGPTASGKSTFVKTLNGLLAPTSGSVTIDGVQSSQWGPELRKKVGLVFQRPERQFFEDTVYGDISYTLARDRQLTEDRIARVCSDAARMVGLDLDSVKDVNPWRLGAADQRKAAIACALVNEPEVLILDEPLVGLDPYTKNDLIICLEHIKETGNISLVIVSHDMDDFLSLIDELLILKNGETYARGDLLEVMEKLKNDPIMGGLTPPLPAMLLDLDLDISKTPLKGLTFDHLSKLVLESFSQKDEP
jgi:energy-coupling factor transport system ATP-binding protein